ncbi:MAG: hypothetical protein QF400_04235 [Candidatus Peribacteraceae bacterium]|nr:hypothetical protein [Candidatus Peribacteraceae bacterium]
MKKLASYIVVLVVTAAAAYLLGAQDAKNERNQELEEKVKLYAGMVVFYQHEDEREDIMDDIEKCLVE